MYGSATNIGNVIYRPLQKLLIFYKCVQQLPLPPHTLTDPAWLTVQAVKALCYNTIYICTNTVCNMWHFGIFYCFQANPIIYFVSLIISASWLAQMVYLCLHIDSVPTWKSLPLNQGFQKTLNLFFANPKLYFFTTFFCSHHENRHTVNNSTILASFCTEEILQHGNYCKIS